MSSWIFTIFFEGTEIEVSTGINGYDQAIRYVERLYPGCSIIRQDC